MGRAHCRASVTEGLGEGATAWKVSARGSLEAGPTVLSCVITLCPCGFPPQQLVSCLPRSFIAAFPEQLACLVTPQDHPHWNP